MLFKIILPLALAALAAAQADRLPNRPSSTCSVTSSTSTRSATRRGSPATPYVFVTSSCTSTVSTCTRTPTPSRITVTETDIQTSTQIVVSTTTLTSTATASATPFPGVYAIYGYEENNCRSEGAADFESPSGELIVLQAPPVTSGQNTRSACVRFQDISVDSLLFQDYPDQLQLPSRCRLYAYQGLNCNTNNGQRRFDISLEPAAENVCRDNGIDNVRSVQIECAAN